MGALRKSLVVLLGTSIVLIWSAVLWVMLEEPVTTYPATDHMEVHLLTTPYLKQPLHLSGSNEETFLTHNKVSSVVEDGTASIDSLLAVLEINYKE